jgi:hypothetical protein
LRVIFTIDGILFKSQGRQKYLSQPILSHLDRQNIEEYSESNLHSDGIIGANAFCLHR